MFKRFYDRKRYLKGKKTVSISNIEHLQLLNTYALGQTTSVVCHLELLQPVKPLALMLPHPIKSRHKILFFSKDSFEFPGLDITCTLDNTHDFELYDLVCATRREFPQVLKLARTLGPLGLMPSPAQGTVDDDLPAMFARVSQTSRLRQIDQLLSLKVGSTDWDHTKILENIAAFVKLVDGKKADVVKSVNVGLPNSVAIVLPSKNIK